MLARAGCGEITRAAAPGRDELAKPTDSDRVLVEVDCADGGWVSLARRVPIGGRRRHAGLREVVGSVERPARDL